MCQNVPKCAMDTECAKRTHRPKCNAFSPLPTSRGERGPEKEMRLRKTKPPRNFPPQVQLDQRLVRATSASPDPVQPRNGPEPRSSPNPRKTNPPSKKRA